jgi:hypothetical protein
MLSIPLQPQPAQTVKVVLDGQNCQIYIYQKDQGLFVDVNSNGVDIVTCVIARNVDPLICRTYAGFVGDLMFVDNQGVSDPVSTGLGDRYSLVYLSASDYDLIR